MSIQGLLPKKVLHNLRKITKHFEDIYIYIYKSPGLLKVIYKVILYITFITYNLIYNLHIVTKC